MSVTGKATNVVCPGCTLLCDDIEIQESDGQLDALNACEKGKRFFASVAVIEPTHHVGGSSVDLKTAIKAAGQILRHSQSPLIAGLDRLTTQSQQLAWKLADVMGATIDTTLEGSGRGSMFALQSTGDVTATMGETASRSDLILFWFCDPVVTHPRLLERLCATQGGAAKQTIVIDDRDTKTASMAGEFYQVQRNAAPALLASLRAIVAGLEVSEDVVENSTGLRFSKVASLAQQLTSASYGTIFQGTTTDNSVFDLACERLHQLMGDLNNQTRFVKMNLRRDFNALSAENVLAWSCGYPFAVNQNRKHPRFHWLEYSAELTLLRQECDAVLLFSGLGSGDIGRASSESLQSVLGASAHISIGPEPDRSADVSIQTRIDGLQQNGGYCRNDDVALRLSAVVKPVLNSLSNEASLNLLLAELPNGISADSA